MEIISLISFTSSIITNISPELNIFTYEVQLDLENTKLSHVENEKLVEIEKNKLKNLLNYSNLLDISRIGTINNTIEKWNNFEKARNSAKQSLYDLSKTVEELSYIIQHLHYCIEELQVK